MNNYKQEGRPEVSWLIINIDQWWPTGWAAYVSAVSILYCWEVIEDFEIIFNSLLHHNFGCIYAGTYSEIHNVVIL